MPEKRKLAHLAMSLDPRTQGKGSDLDNIRLPYDALFETSEAELTMHRKIAGIEVQFPLMFGALTGGIQAAAAFNTALRSLAAQHGLAMCLGSIRAALKNPELIPTYGSGQVDALFANIGISEIVHQTYSVDEIVECCKNLGASGLMVHLNGLQEWVQDEGDHHVCCPLSILERFVTTFPMPVFIKEVGSGIGGQCAQRLASLPIAGIETASLGGTSWVMVEALRRQKPISEANLQALNQLGYSLTESIRDCRNALGPNRTLIASGGIRNAVDIVKCCTLGADLVAIAQPLYAAWHEGGQVALASFVDEWIAIVQLVSRCTCGIK